jgi:hypothetical protein
MAEPHHRRVVGVRSSDRQLRATVLDLNRSGRDLRTPDPIQHKLMRVTNFTLIGGSYFRYQYTVREATMGGTSPYTPALSVNAATYTALSVSEMSNASDYVSYGVLKTHIPAGFAPKPIPINTIVMALPWWASDGTCIYMIVNTQAIDGECGSPLVADDDYGAFLMPSDLIFEGGELDAPEGDYDYGGITFDDFGQFYDPVNQNDQQTYAAPVAATTDYGTF